MRVKKLDESRTLLSLGLGDRGVMVPLKDILGSSKQEGLFRQTADVRLLAQLECKLREDQAFVSPVPDARLPVDVCTRTHAATAQREAVGVLVHGFPGTLYCGLSIYEQETGGDL